MKPDDTLLAYPNLSLAHFATRTVPALVDPWPTLYWKRWLADRLRRLDEKGLKPVVVRARGDLRKRGWGHDPPPAERFITDSQVRVECD